MYHHLMDFAEMRVTFTHMCLSGTEVHGVKPAGEYIKVGGPCPLWPLKVLIMDQGLCPHSMHMISFPCDNSVLCTCVCVLNIKV